MNYKVTLIIYGTLCFLIGIGYCITNTIVEIQGATSEGCGTGCKFQGGVDIAVVLLWSTLGTVTSALVWGVGYEKFLGKTTATNVPKLNQKQAAVEEGCYERMCRWLGTTNFVLLVVSIAVFAVIMLVGMWYQLGDEVPQPADLSQAPSGAPTSNAPTRSPTRARFNLNNELRLARLCLRSLYYTLCMPIVFWVACRSMHEVSTIRDQLRKTIIDAGRRNMEVHIFLKNAEPRMFDKWWARWLIFAVSTLTLWSGSYALQLGLVNHTYDSTKLYLVIIAFPPGLVALSLVAYIAIVNHGLWWEYEQEYRNFLCGVPDTHTLDSNLAYAALGHVERFRCYVRICPVPVFFLQPPLVFVGVQVALWVAAIVVRIVKGEI